MRMSVQPLAPRFWAAMADGRFELPQCERCEAWQGPDASSCERCESPLLQWAAAPPTGTVFSLMEPWAGEAGPLPAIIVVDLDIGLRVMGAMTGSAGGAAVGMRVGASLGRESRADRLPLFTESPS